MPQTLSVIKAGIGGWVGPSAMHPDVLDAARESLVHAMQGGLLIDAHASACGDDLFLVLSHDAGEDSEEIHRFAWDTFVAGTEVANKLKLHGAGQDLLGDTFSGNIRDMGPAAAEMLLIERQSEPVVVFMGDKTSTGAFNLPLYKMFADPFNTPGLVLADSLHLGFSFEVHDVKQRAKIMFNAPDELYDLLLFIGSPSRYAVKRVVARSTGEVAAVASTSRLSQLAGGYVGNDDPTAIVRCQGSFPATGEVLEPFATPYLVEGSLRGSHAAPWMPVGLEAAAAGRFGGPPRVVALGFQLAEGRLVGPRDLFADVSYEPARQEANAVAEFLRKHGPFEPHRLPMDEMEYATMPAVARMANRWSDL